MVARGRRSLLAAVTEWIAAEKTIHAAVLFGSQVRAAANPAAADQWSDIDLHVVTNDPAFLEDLDWKRTLPEHRFCLRVVRPATGEVSKVTALFSEGELDLVLVPLQKLEQAQRAFEARLTSEGAVPLLAALNNMATVMSGGYRFLKGERNWGKFYAAVVEELPGFRISDEEACRMADTFLCEHLWVLQKVQRGELIAAQRVLHRSLVETNVVLLHEARIRAGRPTYQQARRLEKLASRAELRGVRTSARLSRHELREAAWKALAGLKASMHKIAPGWRIPAGIKTLLDGHKTPR
ncbi:MAG: hypothetical protein RIQ93_2890 [Verrucomicrobiota bacterium]|jgi:predicted nucleotidyltransferase